MLYLIKINAMYRFKFVLLLIFIFSALQPVIGQKYSKMAEHSTIVVLNGISNPVKKTFEQNTKFFLDAINAAYRTKKQPKIPASIANDTLNEILGNLWAVSPFLSVRTDVIENLLSTRQKYYEIRNLQIIFEEAQEGYEQQDALILFNKNGKIVDFKIALGYHSVSNILRENKDVTDLRRRQMIISFVEDFRTAYNIKDLNFLDNVFSDKAVIITGKVLQKTIDGELRPISGYTLHTKTEYLTDLKYLFSQTKMLSINFDSITVVQHPKNPDLYGVTLTQTWNSERLNGGKYRDVGYVFLIIDYSKEKEPKIWVRTWQDKQYIALDHGVFNFNHFNIN
jgi:hypothetical protein